MRALLELVRIIFLLFILGGIASYILNNIYVAIGIEQFGEIGFIAILILYFVLYRNKLQFSGWYKGESRKKLPTSVSNILIVSAVVLIYLPLILGLFPIM